MKENQYANLGFFSTLSEAESHFKQICPSREVLVIQVFFTGLELEQCEQHTQIIEFEEQKKLIVLVKSNICLNHRFVVVGILMRDFYVSKEAKKIETMLRRTFIPVMQRGKRGKNISGSKISCTCGPHQLTGFSTTFGCTKGNKVNKCKFNVIPRVHGRQRFRLIGRNNNKSLETFLTTIAEQVSASAKVLVPMCYSNMLNHISKAPDCQIGHSCFGGITILSDFIAHRHFDNNDFQKGATFILSFLKESLNPQRHCLTQYSLTQGGLPGVSFSLGTNSLFMEVAALERHASTPMIKSNPADPSRVAMVFFLHQCLDKIDHGAIQVE